MVNLDEARAIMQELIKVGHKAYLVGGCVRDILLELTPDDYDITTDALPEEIVEVFKNTSYDVILTGLKFGTITIVTTNGKYEISTFRSDEGYSDSRHPDKVVFVKDLNIDLFRRDFTINAMAMDCDGNVIDPYNGFDDLMHHVLKTVNPDAKKIMCDDALRMLRAVRFAVKYSCEIDTSITTVIKENAKLITKISVERIMTELRKMLICKAASVRMLYELGLLEQIIPEVTRLEANKQISKWHYTDALHHTLDALDHTDTYKLTDIKLFYIRFALLLHDTGKFLTETQDENGYLHYYGHPEKSYEISLEVMKRLKTPTNEIETISKLVRYHDMVLTVKRHTLYKIINECQLSLFEFKLLGFIKEADISAHVTVSDDDRMERYFKLLQMYKQKANTDKLFKMEQLVLTGEDIMKFYGIGPGPIVGQIKKDLFDMCFYKPTLNNKETLTNYLKDNYCKYFGPKEDN